MGQLFKVFFFPCVDIGGYRGFLSPSLSLSHSLSQIMRTCYFYSSKLCVDLNYYLFFALFEQKKEALQSCFVMSALGCLPRVWYSSVWIL